MESIFKLKFVCGKKESNLFAKLFSVLLIIANSICYKNFLINQNTVKQIPNIPPIEKISCCGYGSIYLILMAMFGVLGIILMDNLDMVTKQINMCKSNFC